MKTLCCQLKIIFVASDDFTLYMWKPESEKKPDQRLTGHQATINDVKFSPDARYIGSGMSFLSFLTTFIKAQCLDFLFRVLNLSKRSKSEFR